MVLRYLAAFGPASVMDIQAWAGVKRLSEVVEPMRPRLRGYLSDSGRQLWDVPGGEIADEDAPAPPRFLPEYDNAILGYADRSRILPDGVTFTSYAGRLRAKSLVRGGVLVDGFLAATWSVARAPGEGHVLHVDPVAGDTVPASDEVARRGEDLLRFAAVQGRPVISP
jgi:hypothetical protein